MALNLFSRNNTSPITNVAGFVYGSIKNKIVDIMRTRKPSSDIADEEEDRLIDLMNWLYEQADNSYSERMKHELKRAIAMLPANYREVILAVDFEKLTYKQLSEETGISQGTLMSRRHRALSILHNQLIKKKNQQL